MAKEQNRDHPFYCVLDLLAEVTEIRGSYLNPNDLDRLGIKLSDLDINTGMPADHGPQFCDLFTSQEFDGLCEVKSIPYWTGKDKDVYHAAYGWELFLEKCLGGNYRDDLITKSKYRIRSRRGASVFEGPLLRCVSRVHLGERQWQAGSIFRAQDKSLPHRGCLLSDGAVSDHQLRRSEVCCAASLMAARLQAAKLTGDRIVPVFIYSLAGNKARIIQAHYEHPHFIVRKTDHITLEEGNVDGLKLLLRWITNIPKGDVKVPAEPAKKAEVLSVPQSAQVSAQVLVQ